MPRPKAGQPPDYAAAAAIRAALRSFNHATEQITRKHGLTPRRYELLLFVHAAEQTGESATVTTLSSRLQTEQGSITQLVNGAVKAGFLRRTPAPSDRRSHLLHVTASGTRRLNLAFHELGVERERLAKIVHIQRR